MALLAIFNILTISTSDECRESGRQQLPERLPAVTGEYGGNKMWFVSWVVLSTGFFSHGEVMFSYQECISICQKADRDYPEIHHAPMWDKAAADSFESSQK